jgi:hypothetical protein
MRRVHQAESLRTEVPFTLWRNVVGFVESLERVPNSVALWSQRVLQCRLCVTVIRRVLLAVHATEMSLCTRISLSDSMQTVRNTICLMFQKEGTLNLRSEGITLTQDSSWLYQCHRGSATFGPF